MPPPFIFQDIYTYKGIREKVGFAATFILLTDHDTKISR